MNRRQFLGSAAAVSLASAASFARAHGHADYHHHHDMQPAAASAYTAVRQTAAHCLDAGQVCLTHCLSLLTQGDTSMSDCAVAVRQMLALCGAVARPCRTKFPSDTRRGKSVPRSVQTVCQSL